MLEVAWKHYLSTEAIPRAADLATTTTNSTNPTTSKATITGIDLEGVEDTKLTPFPEFFLCKSTPERDHQNAPSKAL